MHLYKYFLFFLLLNLSSLIHSQPYGNSIVMDGSSNYIEVPNQSSLNVTNALTIEAWVNPCKVSGNNMIATKLWCSGAQNSYYFTIKDGKLRWVWFNNACGTPGNLYESNQPLIIPNQWQHVAVVHTTSSVTLYLNGLPISSSLIQGNYGPLKLSTEPLRIGCYRFLGGGYSLFFTGQMDEFRFWNNAQSSSNILSRYNSPLIGNESNLVTYFNMNNSIGGAGNVVPNNSLATGFVLNGTTFGTNSTPYYRNISSSFLLGSDTILCPNTQIILDANISGSTYTWHNGSNGSTFTVSQAGVYSISYANNCGVNVDTITVLYDSIPNINLGNDTVICNGNSFTLDGYFPNATYQWQNGSTNPTISANTSGNYSVTTSGLCGNDSDTINISLDSLPLVNLGNDTTICQGDTLVYNVFSTGSIYNWSSGSNSSVINIGTPGIYWVNVSNFCGSSMDTVQVNLSNSLPSFNLGPDTTLCQNEILILDPNIPNAQYLWQDSSNSPNYHVANTGTYWANVTTNCGSSSDTIHVNFNPIPNINLGSDTLFCNNFILDATFPGATYLWNDNSSLSQLSIVQPGTYFVQVTSNNCSTSDTITVYDLNINLGNDTIICNGDSIELNATLPLSTYLWNNYSITPKIKISTADTYWVDITNSCGQIRDSIIISTIPKPNINLGSDTSLCLGDSFLLSIATPFSNYIWNDGSTLSTLNIFQHGTYSVQVSNPCWIDRDTINIASSSIPQINLGPDTTICEKDSILIDASHLGASITWNDGYNLNHRWVSDSGSYSITASNHCGSSMDSITIGVMPRPNINLGVDTTLSSDSSLILDAKNIGASFLWQNGSINQTLIVKQQGAYWVKVSNIFCSTTDTIIISFKKESVLLELPNIFTPNGDYINDYFSPIKIAGINQLQISFYNKWGTHIYSSSFLKDIWDGRTLSGEMVANGTYYWVIKYWDHFGNQYSQKGSVQINY